MKPSKFALPKVLCPLLLAFSLAWASPAHASASFANRSLGLGLSGFKFIGDGDLVDFGLPISLEGSYYIDSGFVLFLNASVTFFYQRKFVLPGGEGGLVLGGGGQVGLRYLFLEENIRPFVDLYAAVLGIGRDETLQGTGTAPKVFGGPGVAAGVDFFVAESISVGPRAFVDLFITLNFPPRFALGGQVNVATYF